jgi:hypothetical protein
MYKLTLENEIGQQITFNELGGPYTIDEIEGLSPAPATINTSEVALLDGQWFNSSKLQMRTLSIAFAIEYDAAINRIAAYQVCRPKHKIRAYYVSEVRDVYIDGYVQSVSVGYFDMKQVCTVEIICPSPYWRAAQAIIDDISSVKPLFHFPFASTGDTTAPAPPAGEYEYNQYGGMLVIGKIDELATADISNNGEAETGLIFELRATGPISNPKIYDYATGEYIGVNYSMVAGDLITIDTMAGEKSVTLLRDGVATNIFNSLMQGITWLQLPFGGGVYAHEVGSGLASDLSISVIHNDLYEGV